MSTAEDVFYLFERNSRYYYTCASKTEIENCTEYYNNECFCHLKQEVNPFTIGDQYAYCKLNIKCYIKQGDECPICFDPILNKSNAFISNCGHHYHKKCLFKVHETNIFKSYNVQCPMCRCSLGEPEFMQRYRSTYYHYNHKDDNALDKLEDFWLSIEYKIPNLCSNKYDHYLGLHKNCFICQQYREKGHVLYQM